MKPTTEQTVCVDHFGTGRKLRINAYAGTGKTSTLKMLARSTRRRGMYLAFNSAVAKESAREFPRTVQCSTTHGLAFRAMRDEFKNSAGDKMTGNTSAGYLASKLRLRPSILDDGSALTARGRGFLIGETVKRWQRSGAGEIEACHVPFEGKFATLDAGVKAPLRKAVLGEAKALWRRMADKSDPMPLGHDGYLKLWALRRPTLAVDYVLLDEAQDTNGVVLQLMQHQPGQMIAVGDRHQQIYEWRGARNAMVELPADLEARLSTSFRFGPAIADYASEVLRVLGETVPLRGNPDRASALGDIERPDAILTRTNGTLISLIVDTMEKGKRPCVVGGVAEVIRFIEAAEKLQDGQPVEMPLEFFGFANWREVEKASETEDGAELRRWVKLFGDYGTGELRTMLEQLPATEADADVVLSTGHKSKGREWNKVQLADDFLRGVSENGRTKDGEPLQAANFGEELRLYYVAVTRGREAVDIPASLKAKLHVLAPMPAIVQEARPASVPIVAPLAPAPVPADEFEPVDMNLMLPPIDKLRQPASDKGRLVKCACPSCGYIVRTTRKWLKKLGAPICPGHMVAMVEG